MINKKDINWNAPIPRGEIKRFREYLNKLDSERMGPKHKHGHYHQLKRLYGDYLYNQDREKFMVELREWLAGGN